jgi:putative tricarboxylic transport membrane protein
MTIRKWLSGIALACASAACLAQGASWSPERNVEIVVGSAPGGSNDRTARFVEKVLREHKLINSTMSVVNRPGGGGNIYLTYVSQRPPDGYTLMIGTPGLLTGHINGSSPFGYADFTAIASLFNDYTVFAVNSAAPIKGGKDLVGRVRKDPKSVAIGFATTIGSFQHVAAALMMKAVGGNPRDLKVIAYKGSAEAITNLLGAHIDLVTTAAGNAAPHVTAGRMRVVAAAAPSRLGGVLADVPTWKEQGVELVWGGWRAIMGPKGLAPAQVAFWEGVMRKATQVPEWKGDLEKNYWSDDFVPSAQFRKDLEKDYAEMKAVLVDLGLAKQ